MITLPLSSRIRHLLRSFVAVLSVSVLVTGCSVELYGTLDERNANDMLLVLKQAGVSATKELADQGKWRISVEPDAVQHALAVVRRHGLPRAQFTTLGEVFRKEGLVATPAEERQRYAFAVSQELASTLMQIDGVVVARVHPVIPLVDPLSEHIPRPSAAVFIKHLHDADLAPMVPAIKRLVAQSIEGLDPRQVALTFTSTDAAPIQAKTERPQTSELKSSGFVIGGGLALAALMGWPIRRLSRSGARSALSRSVGSTWASVLAAGVGLREQFKSAPSEGRRENKDDW